MPESLASIARFSLKCCGMILLKSGGTLGQFYNFSFVFTLTYSFIFEYSVQEQKMFVGLDRLIEDLIHCNISLQVS